MRIVIETDRGVGVGHTRMRLHRTIPSTRRPGEQATDGGSGPGMPGVGRRRAGDQGSDGGGPSAGAARHHRRSGSGRPAAATAPANEDLGDGGAAPSAA